MVVVEVTAVQRIVAFVVGGRVVHYHQHQRQQHHPYKSFYAQVKHFVVFVVMAWRLI
jgi:hypothetical protein